MKINDFLAGMAFKTKPKGYQLDAVKFGLMHPRFILGDDMGLGKTKEAIDIAMSYKKAYGITHCLVICGVASLRLNWCDEIFKHSNEDCLILGESQNRKNKTVLGGITDRLADVDLLLQSPGSLPFFLITNKESLLSAELVNKLAKAIDLDYLQMIIIDEFHKLKNPIGAKSVRNLLGFERARKGVVVKGLHAPIELAMSGTIAPNKPLDLYVPLKWLGVEYHNFYQFRDHFCVMGNWGNVMGYKNLKGLKAELVPVFLRRTRDEAIDLPPLTKQTIKLEMAPSQAKLYSEVLAEERKNLDNIDYKLNFMNQFIRLRQATVCPAILTSAKVDNAKFDYLLDMANDFAQNGHKAIVYSNWAQVIVHARDTLRKAGIACKTVTGLDADWSEQLKSFKSDPDCHLLLGTIGKLGTGLTINEADTVVFLDEPWTSADKNQAIDRCYRIGQTRNVMVYTLICNGTIDDKVHEMVGDKAMVTDWLVDGKVTDPLALRKFLLS